MDKTIVKCKCISKKERQCFVTDHPILTEINLQVSFDPKSIYYQLSSGTAVVLNTINQDAADIFKIGKDYDIAISPSVAE